MASKIEIPFEPVRFDQKATNAFVLANGVQFEHYKALACPLGMTDAMDTRSPHHEHGMCSNGFIYKYAGTLTVVIKNNSAVLSLQDVGIYDGSVLDATFPTHYDDRPNNQVIVQHFDRFLVKDVNVLVPNTQKFEAQVSGVNKLTYKVEQVEFLMDSNGIEYGPEDYEIVAGGIVWKTSKIPVYNNDLNRGAICSIRYLYVPYFYVQKILHEVRLIKQEDLKGKVSTVRSNYGALLAREYYMYKKEQEANSADSAADAMLPPPSHMFGAR